MLIYYVILAILLRKEEEVEEMKLAMEREKITVGIAMLLFFSVFGSIALMDRSHGDTGDDLQTELVDSSVIGHMGNLQDTNFPEGLLIFGAGQEASLKFEVYNKDPDNDIDTIEVSIPGARMLNGSSEWYVPEFTHEWELSFPSQDKATFTARDDWFGRVIGGSAQYDVVGNMDDALDYVAVNDTILEEISEGVTLTLDFKVPQTPGIKMGDDAIDLKVGDMKTENPGSPLTSDDPFPYPYIVAENESKYMIITIDNEDCDLEVMYGTHQLFSPSRAGDFMISDYGFKYITNDGKTVIVLNEPEDLLVKPLVKAREDNLTGQYTLDIFNITVKDITQNLFDIEEIVTGYEDEIPSSKNILVDTDIDNDGTLNLLDEDMDGDGIPNADDSFPKIFNRIPVITSITDNTTIIEGQALTLSVEASDPDEETVSYLWTNNKNSEWNATTSSITVADLAPGEYIFTVTITDALGNKRTDTVRVTVLENQAPVITSLSADSTEINVGQDVTLTVVATDNENDPLTYTWTMSEDSGFSMQGSVITVSDLKKGSHTFTVTVSDGRSEVHDSITIEVKEKESKGSLLPVILIVTAIIIVIVIVIIVIFVRKGGGDSEKEEKEAPETATSTETFDSQMNYEQPITEQAVEDNIQSDGPLPPSQSYEEVPVQETTTLTEYEVPAEESLEAPEETEENVSESENQNTCPECGALLSDTDLKCPNCGAEFELEFECPNCGGAMQSSSGPCPTCGSEF